MKIKFAFQRAFVFVLCVILLVTTAGGLAQATSIEEIGTRLRDGAERIFVDIFHPVYDTGVQVRDPFVLQVDGVYYMYGTGLVASGYGCVTSTDLKHWSDPVAVFTPPAGFDGAGNWWAPECHYYNGQFYLFATYLSAASGKRGVGIFRADSPLGPFQLISNGHITPKDRDAIDGTLYVDEEGVPWMIYVGEWTSNEDGIGDMLAVRLSDDLASFAGEPVLLFRGTDAPWAKGRITDGPFVYKTKNGKLIMLWSNADALGYCVGIAVSSNGRPDGTWRQQSEELFKRSLKNADGGHGMLFHAPDGTLLLSVHTRNEPMEWQKTTALFAAVEDIGDTLVLKGTFVATPDCAYCGDLHTGFSGSLTAFFHRVLAFFGRSFA